MWVILQGREVRGAAFAAACALVVATQSKDTFYEAPLKWAGKSFHLEGGCCYWGTHQRSGQPQSVEVSATRV